MTLNDLGPRICIMGPSNSGKSTLAAAVGRTRGLTLIHLDLLYHRPNTDWVPRPYDEFKTLHDEAILGVSWAMDGNYSRLLPHRHVRATGIVLLDTTTANSLLRYFRRSWFERNRLGSLDGGKDGVKWVMIRHIVVTTRKKRRRYKEMFDSNCLPKVRLETSSELARFYRSERLVR